KSVTNNRTIRTINRKKTKNMKKNMILMAALATSLTTGALAQTVDVTITGSTAFRSIAQDRVASLYDGGFTITINAGNSANIRTYSGTMSNAFPGATIRVFMSWSGSASGMVSVKNGSSVNTANPGDTNSLIARVPDLAFSDIFPGSANPPIANSSFSKL